MLCELISPISGNFSDVGGMLSPITIRNTVIERRVVMPRVTLIISLVDKPEAKSQSKVEAPNL